MNDHNLRAHSRFSPSGASRWFLCPGSVALCEGRPDEPSEYAKEGTRAHELLEAWFRLYVAGYAGDGPIIAGEMTEAVKVAYDYVADILDEHPDAILWVESRLRFPTDFEVVEGTCDVRIYIPSMRLLYVIDYKHGAGVPVEVVRLETLPDGSVKRHRNKQCMTYGTAAVWECDQPLDTVALVIIQPRAPHRDGPVREEWVTVADIMEFRDDFEVAMLAAMAPDAPLVVGDEQCRWCPAKTICPARHAQALATVGETFAHVTDITKETLPDVKTLQPRRIAEILDARDLVVDWLDAVYAEALVLAKGGVVIPGRKIVEAEARRAYEGYDVEDGATTIAVAQNLSTLTAGRLRVQDFTKYVLRGVTEVDKLLKDDAREHAEKGAKKKAVEEIMSNFALLTTKRSSGALSLVAESDRRPPADLAKATFADVTVLPHIKDENS